MSEVREALKRLDKDSRTIVLHLEKRLDEIANTRAAITEGERQNVLGRLPELEVRLANLERTVESDYNSIQTWLTHTDEQMTILFAILEKETAKLEKTVGLVHKASPTPE